MSYRIDSSVGTFVCESSDELDSLLRRIDAETLTWYTICHDTDVVYDSTIHQVVSMWPLDCVKMRHSMGEVTDIDDCFYVQIGNQIMTNKRLDRRDAKRAELARLRQLRIEIMRGKSNNLEVYATQAGLGQDLDPVATNEIARDSAYCQFAELIGLDWE